MSEKEYILVDKTNHPLEFVPTTTIEVSFVESSKNSWLSPFDNKPIVGQTPKKITQIEVLEKYITKSPDIALKEKDLLQKQLKILKKDLGVLHKASHYIPQKIKGLSSLKEKDKKIFPSQYLNLLVKVTLSSIAEIKEKKNDYEKILALISRCQDTLLKIEQSLQSIGVHNKTIMAQSKDGQSAIYFEQVNAICGPASATFYEPLLSSQQIIANIFKHKEWALTPLEKSTITVDYEITYQKNVETLFNFYEPSLLGTWYGGVILENEFIKQFDMLELNCYPFQLSSDKMLFTKKQETLDYDIVAKISQGKIVKIISNNKNKEFIAVCEKININLEKRKLEQSIGATQNTSSINAKKFKL